MNVPGYNLMKGVCYNIHLKSWFDGSEVRFIGNDYIVLVGKFVNSFNNIYVFEVSHETDLLNNIIWSVKEFHCEDGYLNNQFYLHIRKTSTELKESMKSGYFKSKIPLLQDKTKYELSSKELGIFKKYCVY